MKCRVRRSEAGQGFGEGACSSRTPGSRGSAWRRSPAPLARPGIAFPQGPERPRFWREAPGSSGPAGLCETCSDTQRPLRRHRGCRAQLRPRRAEPPRADPAAQDLLPAAARKGRAHPDPALMTQIHLYSFIPIYALPRTCGCLSHSHSREISLKKKKIPQIPHEDRPVLKNLPVLQSTFNPLRELVFREWSGLSAGLSPLKRRLCCTMGTVTAQPGHCCHRQFPLSIKASPRSKKQ